MAHLKRTIIGFCLICFLATSFIFGFAKKVRAQVVVPPMITLDMLEPKKKAEDTVSKIVMEVGTLALINSANYFFQKLAYDAAVWVASGGQGQEPLFDNRSVAEYFKDTASDTFGTFIDGLNELTQTSTGFDLCAPSMPSLMLRIKLGLISPVGPPKKPTCNYEKFVDNWDTFVDEVGDRGPGYLMKQVGVQFEPGQSPLSYSLELNSLVLDEMEKKTEEAIVARLNSKGWKPITDIISGKVKTPAEMVKKTFEEQTFEGPKNQIMLTNNAFALAIASGGKQVLTAAVNTFANTLITKSMDKIMRGFFVSDLFEDRDEGVDRYAVNVGSQAGRRKAQEIFSDFIKPTLAVRENYDPLIEFTTCPNESQKQINNCVIDNGFATAVRLADQGDPISIFEAMRDGYLDGNRPLISSKDSRNESSQCYLTGYCYSNLVKLRKARIIPVGFELAAELSSAGAPYTLGEVVNGFNICNSNGERDAKHPFCHLIDPNWVLRLPKTKCLAQIHGPTLVSSASPDRSEVCADPITCISQDEDGNCVGGWGYCTKEKNIWRISADYCQEQFNTCTTYQSRDNKPANFLRNTANFNGCNAGNTGCRMYSTSKKLSNGKYEWDASDSASIFFNKDLEKCDSKNAGCTELYSKEGGLAYNLLPNPSFEEYGATSGDLKPLKDWDGFVDIALETPQQYMGELAVESASLRRPIELELNTAYTFSAYAKGYLTGGPHTANLGMRFYSDNNGTIPFDSANIISTCNTVRSNELVQSEITTTDYARIYCSFLTPNKILYIKPFLEGVGSSQVWFDAAQFEEGAKPTDFISEGYGDVDPVFIKTPPKYLDCDPDNQSTITECAGYAKHCKKTEVGCERFTPKTGEPSISAVATINDLCPAVCDGYEIYKQEKVVYEAEKFPLYFIPQTAKTCSANDVGCDEFTDMETEAKEYFSFIRQCIKPGEEADAVFYTWEGSDEAGYQLRSHRLKTGTPLTGEVAPAPAYIAGTDSKLCNKDIFDAPIGSVLYNSDCREFYNADGNISYRLLSKTIVSTEECKNYRKTQSTALDCNGSGGNWDSANNVCIYRGYKAESISCNAEANGCRAYSGAASSNLRIVLQDGFETEETAKWSGGALSSEALNAGGHSLKASSFGTRLLLERKIGDLIGKDSIYSLSFWMKAPGGGDLEMEFSHSSSDRFKIENIKADWKFYEIGPFITGSSINDATKLTFILRNGTGLYIDNVILKEVESRIYLIKNSWNTPEVCDQTAGGLFLPQAMLGCREYTDKNNESVYLKSFSSLCRDSVAGCRAFVNTQNSSSEEAETFGDIEVPADETIYLVDEKSAYCNGEEKGCSALGMPEIYKRSSLATVYYKDKPDDYDKLLCKKEEEGCESWNSEKGIDYFKVPERECEYKEGTAVSTGGWFKKGSDESCYVGLTQNGAYGIWRNADKGYDRAVGLCPSSQNGCTEFIDPNDTSGANKKGRPYYLIDNDRLKELENHPDCSGKASLEAGCVLFNRTDNLVLKWNSDASYQAAQEKKVPVAPIKSGYCNDVNGYETGIVCKSQSDCPDPNHSCDFNADSNTILKVSRDRECGEWLTCKSSYTAYDPITQKRRSVCGEIGLCNKYNPATGSASLCANFVVKNSDSKKVLSANYYSKRNINWSGFDYSGHSIGGQYPVTDIVAENFGTVQEPDFRLVVKDKGNKDLKGRSFLRDVAEDLICRGYPEKDSPFPSEIAQYDMNDRLTGDTKEGFRNANLCNNGKDCECDYTKLTYGSAATNFYTTYGNRSVHEGICQGGSKDGLSCTPGVVYSEDPNRACGKPEEGGTCLRLKRQDDVIGWSGYCLERDLSTPINGDPAQKACLTWLPQDIVKGGRDIYNQFKTAGYTPPIGGGKYYCLEAVGNYSPFYKDYEGLLVTMDKYPNPVDHSVILNSSFVKDEKNNHIIGTGEKSLIGIDVYDPSYSVAGCEKSQNPIYNYYPNSSSSKTENWASIKMLWRNSRNKDNICGTKKNLSGGDIRIFKHPKWFMKVTKGNPSPANDKFEARPIYKDEIDYIEIKVLEESSHEDLRPGTVFHIRSDQKETKYIADTEFCDGTKLTTNCSGELEGSGKLLNQGRAKSLSRGDEWFFRYDDRGGDKNNRDYTEIDLFKEVNIDELIKKDGRKKAEEISADALRKYCKIDTGDKHNQDTYAFRFKFNEKTGVLESFGTLYCHSQSGIMHGRTVQSFSIKIHRREVCAVVADMAAFKNQAFTNKIWELNDENKNAVGTGGSFGTPYHYNYEQMPFGSASSDKAPEKDAWFPYFRLGVQNFSGVLWDCKNNCGSAMPSDGEDGVDFEPTQPHKGLSNSTNFAKAGRLYLSRLFSKIFKIFKLDRAYEGRYIEQDCEKDNKGYCKSDVDEEDIRKFPMIYSYDPDKQLQNGQYQLAEPNKFLINNQKDDIEIRGDQYLAVMRFYFWADKDHMPVKSIRVDWDGDGKDYELQTTDGFYKNHKPLCAKSNTGKVRVCAQGEANLNNEDDNIVCGEMACPNVVKVTVSRSYPTFTSRAATCGSEQDINFGNSSDACNEAFFELQHTYTCKEAKCEFEPKVIIIDNWGIDSTFDGGLVQDKGFIIDRAGALNLPLDFGRGINGPATGPKITLTP